MKFNLRDLFWLMLVAALLTAWYLDHKRLRRKAVFDVINAEGKLYTAWNEESENLDRTIETLVSENRRLKRLLPPGEK